MTTFTPSRSAVARSITWPRSRPSLSVGWRRDLSRDATLLIGLIVGIAYAVGGFAKPVDAVVYWQSGTSADLYPQYWSECCEGHLFYPPPVAQISTVLQPLGWQVFIIVLTVAIFASIWFCARGWSLPLIAVGVPYYLGVGPDLPAIFLSYALLGNLQWILAALTVAAFEHPSAYPLLVLTKGTTGIGLLWLVLRREWKAALIGTGTTAGVVAISFIWAPTLWFDFIGFAIRNASMANPPLLMFPVPFGIRLMMSVLLLVWGARTNRPWVVPIAAGFSIPALWGFGFLPFVVAATRLAGQPTEADRGDHPAEPVGATQRPRGPRMRVTAT